MKFISIFKMGYILVLTILGVILFSQPSIDIYWMQTYHRPSPISLIPNTSINTFLYQINNKMDEFKHNIYDMNDKLITESNHLLHLNMGENLDPDPLATLIETDIETSTMNESALFKVIIDFNGQKLAEHNTDSEIKDNDIKLPEPTEKEIEQNLELETLLVEVTQNESDNSEQIQTNELTLKEQDYLSPHIIIRQNETVFYAGDSLMQGVVPWARRILLKEHKINAIDLSKQSTGLAYPQALDWPLTIEEQLEKNPAIKVLVVFLGPNDPWSFPLNRGDKKYLKFKSIEWENAYRARIERILNAAKKHHVKVIWLSVPCMKKKELHNNMIYLNHLYEEEVKKYGQTFLVTNELLGCSDKGYASSIKSNGKWIKLRADDGIHFHPNGQKILANNIINLLTIEESNNINTEESQ